jgi:hypothetical protein
MKKLVRRALASALLTGAIVIAGAQAGTPQGQKGYEGQPGNQGGYHQSGQTGYEGQPGNQSHNR